MLSVLILLTGCIVLFQSGRFQTWLAKEVAARISSEIGAKVDIRAIKLRFFDRVTLEGFYVEDLHKDTLLYADYVEANFDDVYLGFSHFDFDHATIRDGQFNVRQFEGEEDLNIQFILDAINGPKDTTSKLKSKPPEMFFWDVDVENVDFTYEFRDTIPDTGFGMNYNHIQIRDISAKLSNFLIIDDSLSGKLSHMKFKESSGFQVDDFNADFIVAYTMMDFSNMSIRTPKSFLEGKAHFDYDTYDDLSDFIEKVQMRGKIRKSSVDLDELAVFAPELKGLKQQIEYSGGFKGTVDHLKGFNTLLSFGEDSRFIGSYEMDGLPDTDKMYFHYNIVELQTSKSDLDQIQSYPFSSGEKLALPEMVSKMGIISYRGTLTGYLDDVKAEGKFSTDVGDLEADLRVWFRSELNQYAYAGRFGSAEAKIGKLLGIEPRLGDLSINSEINGIGFDEENLKAEINCTIPFIQLNGYSYSNITATGIVNGKTYDGKLKVNDSNLNLNFSGLVDLSGEKPDFDFQADIHKINLTELKLVKRDSALILSTEITSKFKGKSLDQVEGQIEMAQTSVIYGTQHYKMEDLLFESYGESEAKSIHLYSDMLDAKIDGAFRLASLSDAVSKVLNSFLPSFTSIHIDKTEEFNQKFNFSVAIKDIDLISDLFFPSVIISPGTKINGNFSSTGNILNIDINSSKLLIGGVRFEDFNSQANSENHKLKFYAGAQKMFITDSVQVNYVQLRSNAITDSLGMNFKWASRKRLDAPDAQLNAKASFSGSRINIQVLPSLILIEDTLWQVNEENSIVIDTGLVQFNNLSFTHQKEFIRIDGKVSKDEKDELDLVLDNFQLRNLNPFISESDIKLEGSTRGIISIADLFGRPFFKSDLDMKNIQINNDLIGDGLITSKWDPKTERILLDGQIKTGSVPKLAFNGYFIPSKQKNNIDIQLAMNNIQISLFKKYLEDIFSDISGLADGNIHLTGSPDDLITNGTINLKRTAVTIGLLNTRYFFAHEFIVTKNQIQAKNIQITDENSNSGKLDLKISHTNYDDFYFDVFLKRTLFKL